MDSLPAKHIGACRLRANPNYEFVLLDNLSHQEQQLLGDTNPDSDWYGILRPRPPSLLSLKAVDRETALLFLTLQQPNRPPGASGSVSKANHNYALMELVLNDILEIEWEGKFIGGAHAHDLLYESSDKSAVRGTIPWLSMQALEYAQALQMNNIQQLSARLYFYNRLPLSPRWKKKLSSTNAVSEFLQLEAGTPNRRLLDRYWRSIEPPADNDGWLMWQPRYVSSPVEFAGGIFKLYISPHPEFIPKTLSITIATLAEFGASPFKVGKDVFGLWRTDKLVAYFAQYQELETVALELSGRLEGIKPHGVPFSAELHGDGLLSWGIDPPSREQSRNWRNRESWRLWVTNRLATALVSAKDSVTRSSENIEASVAVQFALARLQIEGVDTDTWTPPLALWGPNAKES
jgi:hypothetical protein